MIEERFQNAGIGHAPSQHSHSAGSPKCLGHSIGHIAPKEASFAGNMIVVIRSGRLISARNFALAWMP